MKFSDLSGAAKGAAILAVLALVISVNFTSTSTVNGVSTCSFIDYGRIGFGALAALVGLGGVVSGQGTSRTISAIAAGIGVLAVLYGLGIILSPC